MSAQVRLIVTDEAWQEIVTVRDRVKHKAGSPPQPSDRRFIAAVLSVARTGIPWRNLPKAFGHWDAVIPRVRRWEKRSVWRRLWEGLQGEEYTRAQALLIDSTMVRAHQQAAQALGRARGGLTTKIHAGCIDEHTVVAMALTSGARNDMPGFEAVLAALPDDHHLEHAVMDRGYASHHIRETLEQHHISPVMPPKKHRKTCLEYDQERYKLRAKIERVFAKLKQFRRIAARDEKLRSTCLACIHLTASCIIVR
jgi:transposase